MKRYIVVFVVILSIGCNNTNKDAEALCNCYSTLLYNKEDTIQSNYIADSCGKLHISIIKKNKKDQAKKKSFDKAYKKCQGL